MDEPTAAVGHASLNQPLITALSKRGGFTPDAWSSSRIQSDELGFVLRAYRATQQRTHIKVRWVAGSCSLIIVADRSRQ